MQTSEVTGTAYSWIGHADGQAGRMRYTSVLEGGALSPPHTDATNRIPPEPQPFPGLHHFNS